MTSIAYLGTGFLGAALAQAAAERGDTVSVWNRTPDKAQPLAQFGAKVAASPRDAVRDAQRVHLVLRDDAVVEEVLAHARGGLEPGAVIVDHTTTLPAATAARLQRLNAEGLQYLHCPVFMGPEAARNAQGSMLVSGPTAVFHLVQAALARMTGRLEYLGERGDLAAVYKLFGNALIIGLGGTMADVVTMAGNASVDAAEAVKLMALLDLNAMAARSGAAMAQRDFTPTFELSMARKDVGLMLETAGGKPMAVLPGVAARMDQLIAAGHGRDGTSVMAIDAGQ